MTQQEKDKIVDIANRLAIVKGWMNIPEETETGINGVIDDLNDFVDDSEDIEEMEREDVIEELIEDDIDTIRQEIYGNSGADYLYNLLKSGIKGFDNFSNLELVDYYFERFSREIKI